MGLHLELCPDHCCVSSIFLSEHKVLLRKMEIFFLIGNKDGNNGKIEMSELRNKKC